MSFIQTNDANDRVVGLWLMTIAFLVFAMIVVGGATRLTESGLSMVHWQPISGIMPPSSEAEWAEEFAAYQQYPEYQKVNRGMTLEEFKGIFAWEYGHRLLGRFIGLAFALPLLYFIARRKVKPEYKMRLFGLLALGGAQGLMGWYMVKSGLVDNPDVSHYRLAAHLLLALVILNVSLWIGFQLLRPNPAGDGAGLTRGSRVMLGLLYLQLFYGALTAGLNAGFSWNSWPLMDGAVIPAGLLDLAPIWMNALENPMTIQFTHRLLAYLVVILAALIVWRGRKRIAEPTVRRASMALLHLTLVQVALGIWTLLAVVPVSLGTLHQGVGVLVFIAGISLLYELDEPAGLK